MASVAFRLDAQALGRLTDAFDDLAGNTRTRIVVRALNRVGDQVHTRVVRVVADETGAKQGRVRNALRKRPATAADGSRYVITARDRFMSLKDFAPAQRVKGISARPWNKRRVFAGSFLGPGGHVFVRDKSQKIVFSKGTKKGRSGNPIRKLWGPAIPRELMRGAAEATVKAFVATQLPARIIHETEFELGRIKAAHRL